MSTERRLGSRPGRFLVRTTILHALTYLVVGIVASLVLDYADLFTQPVIRDYMIEFGSSSPFIGPLVQILRGAITAAVLLPFRSVLGERLGWLWMWLLLVGIGILSTSAASPSSLEGVVYTRLPLWYQAIGLPEMLVQTLIFSVLVALYERHPNGLLAVLPRVFGRVVRALVAASLAFVGYALVSVLFALAAGAVIDTSQSLTLRIQGLFVGPFLVNFLLAFLAAGGLAPWQRVFVGVGSYVMSAAAILAYQGLFLGSVDALYASISPILPAVVVMILVPKRTTTNPSHPEVDVSTKSSVGL